MCNLFFAKYISSAIPSPHPHIWTFATISHNFFLPKHLERLIVTRLLSCSTDATIKVWDIIKPKLPRSKKVQKERGRPVDSKGRKKKKKVLSSLLFDCWKYIEKNFHRYVTSESEKKAINAQESTVFYHHKSVHNKKGVALVPFCNNHTNNNTSLRKSKCWYLESKIPTQESSFSAEVF